MLQANELWDQAGELLANYAKSIETAGADVHLICTNTMHKVSKRVEKSINIPLLHITDATEEDFYAGRLINKQGLEVLVPSQEDQNLVNKVIYEELVIGIIKEDSRRSYLRIMNDLVSQGAEGIIEGCTEIVTLVNQAHTTIPLFDTTRIHSEKVVEFALT